MTASNFRMALGVGTAFSALAALMAGCGEEFSDCAATRTCAPSTGGNAGEAGEGGTSNGKGGTSGAGGGGRTSGGSSGSGGKASSGQAGEGGESGSVGGGRGGSSPAPTDAGAPGSGGEAGASGAGGDGPDLPTSCDEDADCNDRNACNGVETCEAGECVLGTPVVCTSEDPGNCSAKCETVDGAAVCSHQALDTDGDGFKSVACTLSPGDDCNDADDSIHPGAAEMCDGVDSDCDDSIDADEDDVVIGGGIDILVQRNDASQSVLDASIAGYGEKAAANPNSLFAVAWTSDFEGCKHWQTNLLAANATMTRSSGSDVCSTLLTSPIDVVTRPVVTTLTQTVNSDRNRWGDTLRTSSGAQLALIRSTELGASLSFDGSEYRYAGLAGSSGATTVFRRHFSVELELVHDEQMDISGEHVSLNSAKNSVVWALRKSATLDQVFANLGQGAVAVSDETMSASHPLIAWSEDNAYAVAWRYADGRMRFKHFDDVCEIGVGNGFPGELAATSKGYVLVSLSENKQEVVATLIGANCKQGPKTILASTVNGGGDELGEPKVGVTGSYLRAIWKRVTGERSALESKQFSWDECE